MTTTTTVTMTLEGLLGVDSSAALYLMNTERVIFAEDNERGPIVK